MRLLFHELADLTPAERERVFTDRGVPADLRAEVESLLSFDSASDGSLTSEVAQSAGQVLESAAATEFGRCGPYRLVRLVGAGGMGAVYLGERIDGEIQQKVAVKLLRADEHRAAWRDRFLRERQLLASLHHPSIVHVIDAGKTADERPYLVMEFVEGVPIDEYCDGGIGVRERLLLFLRVCEGVSHAHQRLIIHRDLKPSNILVDASGQPKLLDFGIAKLLDEMGSPTQTVERLLTPGYASPEQLRGGIQTTATDVYSLGAVLYKLLTGRSPHESKTGSVQALDVITGKSEITAASRVNPAVPDDLDCILRKALRMEPEERYASVEAFSNDVRAFLDSKPVEARSGNAWYRTRKFLRRYWVPVVAAAMVIASLATGLYVANRQRMIAERRFAQLRLLSNDVLDLDNTIRSLPGSTKARERLVTVSLQYLEGLASDASGDLDLAEEVANGYLTVATVQGVPTILNLGKTAQAEASLKKADGLIESVLQARPSSRTALATSARIANDRMILAQEDDRYGDAVAQAHKAADRLNAVLSRADATPKERTGAATQFGNMAQAHVNMHRYPEAIVYAQRSVELARPLPSAKRPLAQGLSLLANAYRYEGDLDAAFRAIEEARTLAEQVAAPSETDRAFLLYAILFREGLILGDDDGPNLGRPQEAIATLRKAVDWMEEGARKDPNDSATRTRLVSAAVPLGEILMEHDPHAALAVYELALGRIAEVRNNAGARQQEVRALARSSYPLRALHRGAEAKQRIVRAIALAEKIRNDPADQVPIGSYYYNALCAQADDEAEGDAARATESYEKLLKSVMAAHPGHLTDLRNAPTMSRLFEAMAAHYRRTGAKEKAAAMDARRLETWQTWDRKLPNNSYVERELAAARRAGS
ncbi:MAG TPA: protein kinase [Bryobacteraceae bacterium]